MSAEATAYVTALRECPDGAELTCPQKCILWALADHHNRSTRDCMPSHELLAAESLLSPATVKRVLRYLETHLVLKRIPPQLQGRGKYTRWVFLAVDAPIELSQRLKELEKGVQGEPLFQPPEGGQKGLTDDEEGGQKGLTDDRAIRKNLEPNPNLKPGGAKHAPRAPLLSQSERDSLDLKRWQAEMLKSEPQNGAYIPDEDALWRKRAKAAAFDAGVSPARLIELLKQHYPEDPNLELLYPQLLKQQPERREKQSA